MKEEVRQLEEESERIKEVNEVQSELWKVWLEKYEKDEEEKRKKEEKMSEEVRVGSVKRMDELDERIFEVEKRRGFKKKRRVSIERKDMQRRKELCHFWNQGWCKYRTSECKFLHEGFSECKK